MLNLQILETCDRAQKYYRVGWEYVKGYCLIEQSNPQPLEFTSVKLFLLSHALEVTMKGWLILREALSIKDLKKYGHNLTTLANASGQYYPALQSNIQSIDWLNDSYWGNGTRDYEYPEGNDGLHFISPDGIKQLIEACLCDLIKEIQHQRHII